MIQVATPAIEHYYVAVSDGVLRGVFERPNGEPKGVAPSRAREKTS